MYVRVTVDGHTRFLDEVAAVEIQLAPGLIYRT
jgi:hypothetical protein